MGDVKWTTPRDHFSRGLWFRAYVNGHCAVVYYDATHTEPTWKVRVTTASPQGEWETYRTTEAAAKRAAVAFARSVGGGGRER
jgi:hypothetical protein